MNSVRVSRSAKPSDSSTTVIDVGRVGLVELDQPRGERAADDEQPGAQARQPRALRRAACAARRRARARLASEAVCSSLLARREPRDVRLQRVDPARLAARCRSSAPARVALWPPISELLRSIFFWICPGDCCADEPTGSTDQSTKGRPATRASRRRRNRIAAEHARQRAPDRLHGFLHGAGLSRGVNVDKRPPRLPECSHEMPRPTSFGKDTGLQIRMAVTLFLLGAVYVVLGVVAVLRRCQSACP